MQENLTQCISQPIGVQGRYKHRCRAQGFAQTSDVRSYYRRATGHGFQRRQPEAFIEARERKRCSARIQSGKVRVRHIAQTQHALASGGSVQLSGEVLGSMAIRPGNDQALRQAIGYQLFKRPQQGCMVLAAIHARDDQDVRSARRSQLMWQVAQDMVATQGRDANARSVHAQDALDIARRCLGGREHQARMGNLVADGLLHRIRRCTADGARIARPDAVVHHAGLCRLAHRQTHRLRMMEHIDTTQEVINAASRPATQGLDPARWKAHA